MAVFLLVLTSSAQSSAYFDMDSLLEEASQQDVRYLRFIDNRSLSSGIYELKAGDVDQQQPHEWDELYYVIEGKAKLQLEGVVHDVHQGAILFVAANAEHQFVNIQEDLKLLVFFSKYQE